MLEGSLYLSDRKKVNLSEQFEDVENYYIFYTTNFK